MVNVLEWTYRKVLLIADLSFLYILSYLFHANFLLFLHIFIKDYIRLHLFSSAVNWQVYSNNSNNNYNINSNNSKHGWEAHMLHVPIFSSNFFRRECVEIFSWKSNRIFHADILQLISFRFPNFLERSQHFSLLLWFVITNIINGEK